MVERPAAILNGGQVSRNHEVMKALGTVEVRKDGRLRSEAAAVAVMRRRSVVWGEE